MVERRDAKRGGGSFLALRLTSLQRPENRVSFSVGICACDEAENLPHLLDVIRSEPLKSSLSISKIIIVASGCSEQTLSHVRSVAAIDHRISIVEESARKGKADAINKIISLHEGQYILFVNSDALPETSSVSKLMDAILSDPDTGVVSAKPVLESSRRGLTARVAKLMWAVHNESSLILNHLHLSNHSSDEMMVVKSELLHSLPLGLVNDGAYIGGSAKSRGYLVKFCDGATVKIDVPATLAGLVGQRRRILYGHIQIWRLTGRSPKTVESLLLSSPALSFKILGGLLSRNPRDALVLPIALLTEALSAILAIWDTLTSRRKHGVWRRYGN